MRCAITDSGTLRIGIVGVGYWGPNLIRNVMTLPNATVAAVSDPKPDRQDFVRARYPGVEVFGDHGDMLSGGAVDAVMIATPVATHFEIAHQALSAGRHVLLEKPMTASVVEADRLIELAERQNLTLMVDHTFLYTGAVRKIRELVDRGDLGEVLYFDSVRVNLGLFQHDVNVLWDLAPHDLSIMDCVMSEDAVAVTAIGKSHFGSDIANIGYMSVMFSGNAIAHFHVNWLAPVKMRTTLIGGSKKMLVWDDMEPSEKVKLYDKGVEMVRDEEAVRRTLVQYRTGDIWSPKLEQTEALYLVGEEFVAAINAGRSPHTDAKSGRRVVSVLEAANRSMQQGGAVVEL